MCGITGFCDFTLNSSKELLQQMNNTIRHRGPDADGLYYEQRDSFVLGLGHTRLSIIDLSNNGAQPMHYEHLSIVFNGEVYNYLEIKKELLGKGYSFTSDSDTEVVLKAFDCWQHDAVNRFIGMFVFAILNKKTQKLYLYRDRAGVKPLYYSFSNGVFLFGSELKALMAHPVFDKTLDISALSFYLKSGYYHAPQTVFNNCKKMMPGHYLILDIQRQEVDISCYWNVIDFYNRPVCNIQDDEILHETEKLMQSAFNYRMVADVPVGVFLSGGYDSSAVAALLQKDRTQNIKTFTIGFHEDDFNEAPFAKQIAQYLGTEHYEYYCTRKEAQDLIPQLPFFYDEPFGDSSSIPTMLVSAFARKQVVVALSADGGDELFGGYGKYFNFQKSYYGVFKLPYSVRKSLAPISDWLQYIPGFPNGKIIAESLSYILKSKNKGLCLIEPRVFSEKEIHKILKENFQTSLGSFDEFSKLSENVDLINSMLSIDYKTYMVDDILTKVDRATMAYGLEGREPFIDHRLVQYLASIPSSSKVKDNIPKYLLKEIVHKYIPKDLMNRPKKGFGIPLHLWFKGPLKYQFEEVFNLNLIENEGIFNKTYIDGLLKEYFNGDSRYSEYHFTRLWYIFCFISWQRKWL